MRSGSPAWAVARWGLQLGCYGALFGGERVWWNARSEVVAEFVEVFDHDSDVAARQRRVDPHVASGAVVGEVDDQSIPELVVSSKVQVFPLLG